MIEIPTTKNILLYSSSVINVESEYVDRGDYADLPALRDYLLEVMEGFSGDGLSAPQVGVFKQVLIMRTDADDLIDMVNPDIVWMHGKETPGVEFCLNIPPHGNGCLVPRMEHIAVEFSTCLEPGIRRRIELSRRDAMIAQHHIDHLTGTFFFDRVNSAIRKNVLNKFNEWKKENKNGFKNDSRQLPSHCLKPDLSRMR